MTVIVYFHGDEALVIVNTFPTIIVGYRLDRLSMEWLLLV
jgi:hypothetical protein